MSLIITTVTEPTSEVSVKALEVSSLLACAFYPRGKNSLPKMLQEAGANELLVVGREKITWYSSWGEYAFHPNMAKLRILGLQRGQKDTMTEAMSLNPGDVVLDGTLGLGADALVSAFAAGPEGRVIGIEANRIMAYLVGEGLGQLQDQGPELTGAANRINVICGNHLDVMQGLDPDSVDIVYFDPMFRQGVTGNEKSVAIDFLRDKANASPLSMEAINRAKVIARKRVVMKERKGSSEFERLGFNKIVGGKYSSVAYGFIDI